MKDIKRLVVVVFLMCGGFVSAYDWASNPGDGSAGNPYQITSPEQLIAIGSDPALLDKHFILLNDIVFEPETRPDHVFTAAVIAPYEDLHSLRFSGFFDGNNRRIVNLKILGTGYNVGLFGQIDGTDPEAVAVRNLTFVDPLVSGPFRCGALAGRLQNRAIESCHVIGGSSGFDGTLAGGLVGAGFSAIISGCTSSATVSGTSFLGGLIGSLNSCTLIHSSASGNVSGTSSLIGGLVGNTQKETFPSPINDREEIVNCYATGDVYAGAGTGGGLAGRVMTGLVKNSYATGTVTGGQRLGGLIGYVEPQNFHVSPPSSGPTYIIGCYAAGDVQSSGRFVGGLIGCSEAVVVKDCYALGNVSAAGQYVGGLIGLNRSPVICSFSKGTVSGVDPVGGLIGNNILNSGIFLSFWDTQASQLFQSDGGTGKTAAQMRSRETFDGWGDDIWVLQDEIGYPRLAWEDAAGEPITDEMTFSGGYGTPQDPYHISTVNDLIMIGKHRNNWDKHFVLTNDIVLDPGNLSDLDVLYNQANFNKIGIEGLAFSGSVNGNFYGIYNLRNLGNEKYTGLFGNVRGNHPQEILVQNLKVVNPAFSGDFYIGGLMGYLENGKAVNCAVENFSISCINRGFGFGRHGGLVGGAWDAELLMCYAQGTFGSGYGHSGFDQVNQGGLAGSLVNAAVRYSYAICHFNSTGTPAGGLVGDALESQIYRCYAVPSVSGHTSVSGLVGYQYNSLPSRCYYRSGNWILPRGGGYGLNNSEMKQIGSFSNWDFVGHSGMNNIWRMCVDGVDYPRLSWEFSRFGDFACGDGVDVVDFLALAQAWLAVRTEDEAAFDFACDANGDGRIDFSDFIVLSENWMGSE